MENIFRKIFDDPEMPMNREPPLDSMAAKLSHEREELFLALKERLSPEDMNLLEQYADKSLEMQGEYEYMAFCCGLEYAVRFFAEAFLSL